jgi:hypothetical protein
MMNKRVADMLCKRAILIALKIANKQCMYKP